MSRLKKAKNVGIKIKNISLKKYLSLDYKFKYQQAYEFIEPKNYLNGKTCNINDLTFNEVTTIKLIYQDVTVDKIKNLFSITYNEDNLLNCGVLEFFQSKKWLDDEVAKIIKREKELLYRPPDPKETAVGVNSLNRFGSANTTVSIGKQFGFRPRDVGEWKYTEVLIIQAINVTVGEIKEKLAKQK